MHNLGLSSDELTLSASGMSEASGLSLAFYDVRTFINKVINSHNNPPTANGVVRFRHGETEFRAHALISIESTKTSHQLLQFHIFPTHLIPSLPWLPPLSRPDRRSCHLRLCNREPAWALLCRTSNGTRCRFPCWPPVCLTAA